MGCGRRQASSSTRTVSGARAVQPYSILSDVLTHYLRRELLAASEERKGESAPYRPPVLLPLEVMVRPLELRFQYHFLGDRPTNRLDKVCASGGYVTPCASFD